MTKSWAGGVCRTNEIDAHCLRTGGAEPPLVALHGLTGSGGACWTQIARSLEAEWDVGMPDAGGHGKSSAPARGYTYEYLAGGVAGLVAALGLDAPALLGHPMGGMTAALAANRLGAAVRAVVLGDPTFLSPERQRQVHESDVRDRHRRLLATSLDEALADARRRHPRRSPEIVKLVTDARLQTTVRAFDVLARREFSWNHGGIRRPRESGGPGLDDVPRPLDPRFRGDDDVARFESPAL